MEQDPHGIGSQHVPWVQPRQLEWQQEQEELAVAAVAGGLVRSRL